MLRVFKGTGPGIIALIILFLLLLWIGAFIQPPLPDQHIYETRPMPLYGLLKSLIGQTPLSGVIFSFLLLAVMLILLVHFNTAIFFINQRTFLPAFLYLLLTSLFPQNQILNPVLPSTLMLMAAMLRIMDSYRKQGVAYNFFDAGFLISTASLFYAGMIWFGLLVIIGIAILRTGSIKETAIAIIGLLAPWLIVFGIYYLTDRDLVVFLDDVRENLFSDVVGYDINPAGMVSIACYGLVVLLSIFFLLSRINAKKIKSRKTFFLLLWVFFISLGLYFVVPAVSVEMVWITAIPATYLMAHYFVFTTKWLVPEIIFSGLVLLVVLVQVLNII